MRWANLIHHSNDWLYNFTSALLINAIVFISTKLLMIQNQPYAYYSKQKESIITQCTLLNVTCLTISPIAISYIIDPAILYDPNCFIPAQVLTLIIFFLLSIADIYLSALCCNRQSQAV
jgi:hypothetical protein